MRTCSGPLSREGLPSTTILRPVAARRVFEVTWETIPGLSGALADCTEAEESMSGLVCAVHISGMGEGLRVRTRVADVSYVATHESENLDVEDDWHSHCVKPAMNFVSPGIASGSTIAAMDYISSIYSGLPDETFLTLVEVSRHSLVVPTD